MGIHVTEVFARQQLVVDEGQHFLGGGAPRLWQVFQGTKNLLALPKSAESELADHEWVAQHPPRVEQ